MSQKDDEIPGGLKTTGIYVEPSLVSKPENVDAVKCSYCDHLFSEHYSNPCKGIKRNGDPCDCTKFQD